jgi:hypothetical protein
VSALVDRIVARLDSMLLEFAGSRDESAYVRVREIMASHPDYRERDAFLERSLAVIDGKIGTLLVHTSVLTVVAVLIAVFTPKLVALLAGLIAAVLMAICALLLRCTRVFGAADFGMSETLTANLILDRMASQISLRTNVYRKALRVATVATLAYVPLLLVAAVAVLAR